MGSYTLVDEQLEAGRQFLAALRTANVPVEIVFWHRPEEAAPWTFCIATPLVEQDGLLAAAKAVIAVRRSFGPDFAIGPNDVNVIKGSHPLVKALLGQFSRSARGWENPPLLVNGWEIKSEWPQWYQVARATPAVARGT